MQILGDNSLSGDLHCHTRLSDGSMGIEELIALAKKRDITTIAITDHDCLAGTVRGKRIGERNGINVIPGVEISATDTATGRQAHILCYLCEYPDRLEGLCRKNSIERKKAAQFMMLKATKRYPISSDIVLKCASGSTNLYKQHIMHAIMEAGYSTSIYGPVYNELFSPDSLSNIIVNPTFESAESVLKAIHDAGGIAVLAHPALYDSFDLLDRLVALGLDGVEVWHPTADADTVKRLTEYAKKNKLLMTGGSDFHGMYNRSNLTVGSYVAPKQQITELMGYKTKQKRLLKKAAEAAVEKIENEINEMAQET